LIGKEKEKQKERKWEVVTEREQKMILDSFRSWNCKILMDCLRNGKAVVPIRIRISQVAS
jgi:hypothetical protein